MEPLDDVSIHCVNICSCNGVTSDMSNIDVMLLHIVQYIIS